MNMLNLAINTLVVYSKKLLLNIGFLLYFFE